MHAAKFQPLPFSTYLVGGAVRDQLLGETPREYDWVVLGATPEEMLELGFQQVGADFPVFLHPETHDEYALARTERKAGHGYHGFTVAFGPEVTLEEDLERRDLTINAIARDAEGNLIDPWGGQKDLEARVLRHVSSAFAEDPLRVLRVARFAARLAPFGFTVADETLDLMRSITESGELAYLTQERVFAELEKSLVAARPSRFLAVLRDCGALNALLPEVDALYGVPQVAHYHPEIDTGDHLERVLDYGAENSHHPRVQFAALLHDLGKGITDPDILPSHVGHEEGGVPLVEAVCERLKAPKEHRRLARLVCRWHLHCHRLLEMRASKVLNLIESLDGIRRPDTVAEFATACLADARGRLNFENCDYPQAQVLIDSVAVVKAVDTAKLLEKGYTGLKLASELRQSRIKALKQFLIQFREEAPEGGQ